MENKNMLKDILNDIVRHTSGVGFIDVVKLTGEEGKVSIESMDNDRNVVIQGVLKDGIDELEGTVGLTRMQVLDRYLNYDGFGDDSITLKTQQMGDSVIPTEVSFSCGRSKSSYRFMAESMVNDVLKVPQFKGVNWDVEIKPGIKSLKDLQYFSGALGKQEPLFTVSTEDGNLVFSLGSTTSDRASVTVADDVNGELKSAWKYPIHHVLAVLKLMEDGNDCTLRLSDMGAMQLELNSGLGTYKYTLSARK
jgi:hypothetical protein